MPRTNYIWSENMQDSLLQQGVDITLYGMGIVFLFLSLLVICTILMSKIVARYLPEPLPTLAVSSAPSEEFDPKLFAIIQAAIQEHRTRKR